MKCHLKGSAVMQQVSGERECWLLSRISPWLCVSKQHVSTQKDTGG